MAVQNLQLEPLPILIVDDEPHVLKALERDLSEINQVETSNNPEEALQKVKQQEFCVIVSDFKMPQMNGLDFLEECSKIRPESKRLLITGYDDMSDMQKIVNRAKLNGILLKPWEKAQLQDFASDLIRQNYMHRENSELRRLAWSDSLTGIPNHRYFWERLESEFSRAKRYKRDLSLIMADIDNFKSFNDKFGHQHGDLILKKVAQCMDAAKRQMDTVARYGGEEFCIVLPEAQHEQALLIAQRLQKACLDKTGISLSMGVSSFPNHGDSTTELLYCADQALLLAKMMGKNQVRSAQEIKRPTTEKK
ncbi:MAG: diguanylate cyclase [Proteobacteria bacterium]|nr:diguanylate cyclase [Pseudomonadota bacterium]